VKTTTDLDRKGTVALCQPAALRRPVSSETVKSEATHENLFDPIDTRIGNLNFIKVEKNRLMANCFQGVSADGQIPETPAVCAEGRTGGTGQKGADVAPRTRTGEAETAKHSARATTAATNATTAHFDGC
jgi:hypothetical protein